MLIIAIISAAISVALLFWGSKIDNFELELCSTPFAAILIVVLLTWPIAHYCTLTNILQFQEFNRTLQTMRANGKDLETAAAYAEIAKWNEWLVVQKFWNQTIFGDAIPDAVEELEPIY